MLYVILTQGNGVAAGFHSESEALATIRKAEEAHGRRSAARYALVVEDGAGLNPAGQR